MSLPSALRNRGAAFLVLFGAALVIVACGGNTPSAPPPPPPPPPPPQVRFSAAANPGADAIGLALASSTAAEFTLTLEAVEVTDLFGFGVDITFDPAVIMFEGFEAGNFLGGGNLNTQVVEQPDGTLIIGQTRVGDVAGIDGSGTLLTLNFASIAAGSTTLETANSGAFDSTGAAMETAFFGGTATVPAQAAR